MATSAGDASGEVPIAPKSEDELPSGVGQEPALKERVDVKERACKVATDLLTKISSLGETGCKIDPSWVQRTEMILNEYGKFSYEVGVAGDTGMGKTSLMNALMGHYVAPESQFGAGTAAVCRFKYNKKQQTAKFRATVIFKSKDRVDEELKSFFSAFSLISAITDDDASASYIQDEKARYDQGLQIISMWSGIEATAIQTYGLNDLCHEITSKGAATEFFDLKLTAERMSLKLNAKTTKSLLQQLRPYISGSKLNAKYWPLVECVDVFVPSDFLICGVTLVDLPGELDATESRSEVAKKYYNRLDKLMIVTPCDRAADNKTATDLLRDDQILDLDAAGQIDNRMCIVSTKIDGLDWEKFVDSTMAADDIAPNFQALLEDFETTREILKSGYDDQLQTRRNELAKECFSLCIKARNREIRKALQEYFDNIRNSCRKKLGRSKTHLDRVKTHLDVFPVSSKAEFHLQDGTPDRCFRDSKATGFEDLRSWIHNGLLLEREKFLDKALQDCVALFAAAEGWLESEFGTLKPPLPTQALTSSLKEVNQILEEKKKILRKSLGNATKNFGVFLGREAKRSSFTNERSISKLKEHFIENVQNMDRETQVKTMHAATFDACVRRLGGLYRTSQKPRKTYDWQGKLKMFYWSVFLSEWTAGFQHRLPKYLKTMERTLFTSLSNHNYQIIRKGDMPPEYVDVFQRYSYQVEIIVYEGRSKIANQSSKYIQSLRDISAGSRELLLQKMRNLYVEASQKKGKGKYARQKAAMKSAAKDLKEHVFAEVGMELDRQFLTARKTFADTVKKVNDEIQKKLFSLEDSIATQIYAPSLPKKPTKKVAEAEKSSKEQLGQTLNEWKIQWEVLREKIPNLQMQFVSDEEMREIEEAEEHHGAADDTDNDTTTKKLKRSKQSGRAEKKKRKTKETTSTKESGVEVKREQVDTAIEPGVEDTKATEMEQGTEEGEDPDAEVEE